jgi:hypothetical protein
MQSFENDMKFDIVNWLMDNFTDEDRQWIGEMSKEVQKEVLTNMHWNKTYWERNLPSEDFTIQSDGFSEPLTDLDYQSPQP